MPTSRSRLPERAAAGSFLPRVGVLLYDGSVEVDPVLAAGVALVRARGIRVGGQLQHFGERLPNGKRSMWLEDIATGAMIRLDRPRGRGAVACMLDPDALAQAAYALQRSIAGGVDLLVINRFGNAEADGRGTRAEFADAICAGAAVLVAVRYNLLDDLEGFLGGTPKLLLPAPDAVLDWALAAVAETTPTGP
jgi:hypothetical protein